MRYCSSDKLTAGMILAKPLYTDKNKLLLGAGNRLTDTFILRVRNLSLSYICIEEPGTERITIDDPVDDSVLVTLKQQLRDIFDEVLIVLRSKRRSCKTIDGLVKKVSEDRYVAPIDKTIGSIRYLVEDVHLKSLSHWDALLNFSKCVGWREHGVDVALISILLAYQYQFKIDQLIHLGLGALLHDLGKVYMPEIAAKRRSDLNAEEIELYRKHPMLGVSLLEYHSKGHYVAKECLLQHHEKLNGKGFPKGLTGEHLPPVSKRKYAANEIYHYAEIVSVADAYVNLVTGAWYKRPMTPDAALSRIIHAMSDTLNRPVSRMLAKIILPFPTGAPVRITHCAMIEYVGFYGVVSVPNRHAPHKADLVLYADSQGKNIRPESINLKGDSSAELELDVTNDEQD
ncbi:MAG: HD domain-containing phosphohydrolase [bacterium]